MINKLKKRSAYAHLGQALSLLFLLVMVYFAVVSWQDISSVYPVVVIFTMILLSAVILQNKKPIYSMVAIFVLFVLLLGTSVQMGFTLRSIIMPTYFFIVEVLYLIDYFFYQKIS